jgi:hypothetical protein
MSAVDSLAIVMMGHSLNVIGFNPDHKDGPCVWCLPALPVYAIPYLLFVGAGLTP